MGLGNVCAICEIYLQVSDLFGGISQDARCDFESSFDDRGSITAACVHNTTENAVHLGLHCMGSTEGLMVGAHARIAGLHTQAPPVA